MCVRRLTVADVLDGKSPMPFMSPVAWKMSQHDCAVLRRVYAHLYQGTRPGSKSTKIRNVKRYLRVCTIGRDGILVVRKSMPFTAARDLIVIPRHLLAGLLTAIHLCFDHPTACQLRKVFHRYFYALDADSFIDQITSSCSQCAALARLPAELQEFSTSDQPLALGTTFACDVLCRARQHIFLIRDCFSSFTICKLVQNEQSDTLRAALIETTAPLKAPGGCVVRVDPAPGFSSLSSDKHLAAVGIHLDIGRVKNKNKNPVGEKAIQELEFELKRVYPDGSPVSDSSLAQVTATLNPRIRNRGLSAKEIIFQRDNMTGEQLHFSDVHLAKQQQSIRQNAHGPSARCQARNNLPPRMSPIKIGEIVLVKGDGDKHHSCERYLVIDKDKEYLYARKLAGIQYRSKVYKLKFSEVFTLPSFFDSTPLASHGNISDDSDSSSDGDNADSIGQDDHSEVDISVMSDSQRIGDDIDSVLDDSTLDTLSQVDVDMDVQPNIPFPQPMYDLPALPVIPDPPPDPGGGADHAHTAHSDHHSDGSDSATSDIGHSPRHVAQTNRHSTRPRKVPYHLKDYVLESGKMTPASDYSSDSD